MALIKKSRLPCGCLRYDRDDKIEFVFCEQHKKKAKEDPLAIVREFAELAWEDQE